MRALHLATRLAGTDGVSLEATKVARVLGDLGFERRDVAGDVETPGAVALPAMHFRAPEARALQRRAFPPADAPDDPTLPTDLATAADRLADAMLPVVRHAAPDLLVVQNAWAIPMHLPLAGALARVVDATGLPTLSHEHDYAWERDRFAHPRVPDWLETYFPWDAPHVRHLAINTPAADALAQRRGLHATVAPNVMDFGAPRPTPDEAADVRARVRAALGLQHDRRLILQPTRVVPRKGIHLAVELLARLDDPRNVLVITHASGDEGDATLAALRAQADAAGVDLRYVPDAFGPARDDAHFALRDAYLAADFVTYPSLYEGFGNALLETLAFDRVALVNRYDVYVADIAPAGLDLVEIDGAIDHAAVARVRALLDDPEARARIAAANRTRAAAHFGLPALRAALEGPLASLGVTA
ncbi:MAG: glycosyltransferase family 4 protein [Trueperaceae bacterium]|nr:glycosyltransferase family 4 protein [Trueperaceae bacterium]